MKRMFSFVLIFSLFCAFLSAEPVISDYTRQKIEDFVTLRVSFKDEKYESAIKKIEELKTEAF